IQEKYKTTYYTKSIVFELYKAELLLKAERYADAKKVLDALEISEVDEDIANKFNWTIQYAKTTQGLHDHKQARQFMDDAFSILNTSDKTIESASLSDIKPIISFETIDGFMVMGDFYLQRYKEDSTYENLRKATHRYLLAAKI